MLIRFSKLVFFVLLTNTCGLPGAVETPVEAEDPPGLPLNPAPDRPAGSEWDVAVGLNLMTPTPSPSMQCHPSSNISLHQHNKIIKIDGLDDEWPRPSLLYNHPEGNFHSVDQIEGVRMMKDRSDDVVVFVNGDFSSEQLRIELSLSRLALTDGQWSQSANQILTLFDPQQVSTPGVTISRSAQGVEARISASLVEGTIYQRAWAIEVRAVDTNLTSTVSVVGPMVFSSSVPGQSSQLISDCIFEDASMTYGRAHVLISDEQFLPQAQELTKVSKAALFEVVRQFRPEDVQPVFPAIYLHDLEDDASGPASLDAFMSPRWQHVLLRDVKVASHSADIHRRTFEQSIHSLINQMMHRKVKSDPTYYDIAIARAVSAAFLRSYLGEATYFTHYRSLFEQMSAAVWYDMGICASRRDLGADLNRGATLQKAEIIGLMIGSLFNWTEIWQSWMSTVEVENVQDFVSRCQGFVEELSLRVPERNEVIQDLRTGWLETGVPSPLFELGQLADPDKDRLPSFYESSKGFNPLRGDSDRDGWSDFAEVAASTGPLSETSNPAVIMSDGLFGDWQKLMSSRIHDTGIGASSNCSPSMDIQYVAALLNSFQMVAVATLTRVELGEPDHQWSLFVQFKEGSKEQILELSHSFDTDYVEISDAKSQSYLGRRPIARPDPKVFEIGVDLGDFIAADFDQKLVEITYRLQLFENAGERFLCDETSWHRPWRRAL